MHEFFKRDANGCVADSAKARRLQENDLPAEPRFDPRLLREARKPVHVQRRIQLHVILAAHNAGVDQAKRQAGVGGVSGAGLGVDSESSMDQWVARAYAAGCAAARGWIARLETDAAT